MESWPEACAGAVSFIDRCQRQLEGWVPFRADLAARPVEACDISLRLLSSGRPADAIEAGGTTKPMNKADLITEVQKHLGIECSKAHAERAVNAVLSAVTRGLQVDGEVQLVGFGTFHVKHRAARTGLNPQTKQAMQIPASRTVGFRIGSGLRSAVAAPEEDAS